MLFLTYHFIDIFKHHTFIPGHLLANVFVVFMTFVILGGHTECQRHIIFATSIANIISLSNYHKKWMIAGIMKLHQGVSGSYLWVRISNYSGKIMYFEMVS